MNRCKVAYFHGKHYDSYHIINSSKIVYFHRKFYDNYIMQWRNVRSLIFMDDPFIPISNTVVMQGKLFSWIALHWLKHTLASGRLFLWITLHYLNHRLVSPKESYFHGHPSHTVLLMKYIMLEKCNGAAKVHVNGAENKLINGADYLYYLFKCTCTRRIIVYVYNNIAHH